MNLIVAGLNFYKLFYFWLSDCSQKNMNFVGEMCRLALMVPFKIVANFIFKCILMYFNVKACEADNSHKISSPSLSAYRIRGCSSIC